MSPHEIPLLLQGVDSLSPRVLAIDREKCWEYCIYLRGKEANLQLPPEVEQGTGHLWKELPFDDLIVAGQGVSLDTGYPRKVIQAEIYAPTCSLASSERLQDLK